MISPLTALQHVSTMDPTSVRRHHRVRLCGLAGAALLLAACASAPKPTEIEGSLTAVANVNPSVSQRPSPLLVRLYELKTASAFNNADFVSLYQRDQAELGADLVAREEIVLNPGESRPIRRVAGPETRFIGVLAGYRDLDRAKWRTVVPVQQARKQTLTITAGELAISATVAP
jgi:type VI secretion system protein VasD